MPLFPKVKMSRTGRKFLVKNVDMRLSFESLSELAITKVGCDFDAGDICYFQNVNETRRKVLLMREGVLFQLYWMKVKGKFVPINDEEGPLKSYINFME